MNESKDVDVALAEVDGGAGLEGVEEGGSEDLGGGPRAQLVRRQRLQELEERRAGLQWNLVAGAPVAPGRRDQQLSSQQAKFGVGSGLPRRQVSDLGPEGVQRIGIQPLGGEEAREGGHLLQAQGQVRFRALQVDTGHDVVNSSGG